MLEDNCWLTLKAKYNGQNHSLISLQGKSIITAKPDVSKGQFVPEHSQRVKQRFFCFKKLTTYKSSILSHSILKVLLIAKKIFFLPQVVLPFLFCNTHLLVRFWVACCCCCTCCCTCCCWTCCGAARFLVVSITVWGSPGRTDGLPTYGGPGGPMGAPWWGIRAPDGIPGR